MKNNIDKILSSPLFFHIAVLLLYILIFSIFLEPSMFLITLLFTASYPFFTIAIAIVIRKAFINTYQAPLSEEFVNKSVIYNRYLITAIYVLSLGVGFLKSFKATDAALASLFFLFVSGLCFFFYLFILPILIRLILLKKASLMFEIVMLGIFFLLFLWGSYMIDLITNHYLIQRLYDINFLKLLTFEK